MTTNQLREMWNSLGIAILLLISSGWSDAKSELDELTGGIHTRVGVEDTTKTPVGTIKINSDLSGKVFNVGDSLNIKWDATEVPSITIQVSINGKFLVPMLAGDDYSGFRPGMDNWGDFTWIVPDTLPFGESLLDQNVRLVVVDYWDPDVADTTASFKVVQNSNIQLPSLSHRTWSVLLDGRGGHKLYINEAGSYTVRILNMKGAVHQEFTCPGRTWHTFKMRQGPGVYLIRIGSGSEKSIQRLFVIQ